jgi:hypothetical protein
VQLFLHSFMDAIAQAERGEVVVQYHARQPEPADGDLAA